MGQYRVWIGIKAQFGFCLRYEHGISIVIDLPLISVHIGMTDGASGFGFN